MSAQTNSGKPRPSKPGTAKMGRARAADSKGPAKSPILAAIESFGDPRELAEAVVTGQAPPGAAYTVTRLPAPPDQLPTAADVAALRAELGLSQAKFAAFAGVSVDTVRAWEQGRNPLSGLAARFLAVIRADLNVWKARLAAG